MGPSKGVLVDLNGSAEGCHFSRSLFYQGGKNGVLVQWWIKSVVGLSDLDLIKLGNKYLELKAQQTACSALKRSLPQV